MANKSKRYENVIREVWDFLHESDTMAAAKRPVSKRRANQWDEIPSDGFRNMKVFMKGDETAILIVVPGHVIDENNIPKTVLHVIREDITKKKANGKYETMTIAEFEEKYKCNHIKVADEAADATLDEIVACVIDNMSVIAKLARKTPAEKIAAAKIVKQMIISRILGMRS